MFGASDEAGGTGPPGGPSTPSAVGSLQATAGIGSSSPIGAASSIAQPALSSTAGGGGGAGGVGGGGEEIAEECVICLTDPKDTVLLPCRHLCVCSECFRHVDKCPVCRSPFDNYVVLSGPEQAAEGGGSTEGSAVGAAGASNVAVAPAAPPYVPRAGFASTLTASRAIGPRRVTGGGVSAGGPRGEEGAAEESGFRAAAAGAVTPEGTVGGGPRGGSGLRAPSVEASGSAPPRRDIFAVSRSRVRVAGRGE